MNLEFFDGFSKCYIHADRHVNKLVGALRMYFSLRSVQKFPLSIILEDLTPVTSGPTGGE